MVTITFKTKKSALDYLRKNEVKPMDIVYIAEYVDRCRLVYRAR